MSVCFVTRHPGARDWAGRRGLAIDRFVQHLDPGMLRPGDLVIGTLPVNLIAEIQRLGCGYVHLSLELPAELRGRELSAEQLDACGARLRAYEVKELPLPTALTQAESP